MPELPEVETVVRDIRPCLIDQGISAVKVSKKSLRRGWSKKWTGQIQGRTVQTVRRRGKWILIDLDGPSLVIHLGMTGQLTVVPAAVAVADHTHLIFTLNEADQQLRFRDVRRFGSATLFADQQAVEAFFTQSGLGPEPFDIDPTYWQACLRKTSRCLKAILLDQRVLAGVGNIYADESLFVAKLHPARLGKEIQTKEANRLRQAVADVLSHAIEKRGSTIRDYIGGSGLKGEFQDEFRVYGRTNEPCAHCQAPIHRIVLAGRSTHFCNDCQK